VSANPVASAPLSADEEAFIERVELTRITNPGNRSARFVTRSLVETLPLEQRDMLRRCCRSGAVEPDSEIGCYLQQPGNLRELAAFFEPLIRDYHHAPSAATHVSGWEILAADGSGAMDLSTFGMPPLSMRVRVARNLDTFRLPAAMDRPERELLEQSVTRSLQSLIDHPDYGGRIYSLTPDFDGERNPNLISRTEYQELVAARVMFRDMGEDRFMRSAGIAGDWPHGRACYVSRDRELIVWIGEEDHLRIICMKTGTVLREVFERLRDLVAVIESLPGMAFARDSQFGYVTSCPSNLGTGMRASLHVTLPRLMRSGVDLKQMCDHFGLSVCGPGGDRTPIRAGGILELSPVRRAFVRERDIIKKLYEGVRQLSMLDAA
jgi:hypothetical protein